MTSLAIADRTINVPFYGSSLFVVEHNGEPYTPMKPIIDGMGMDWASQFTKLKQRFKSTVVEITMVAADGKSRAMICLALRKLNGWLRTISPNKVRPEIRDKVIQYQEECDDVLYEYWTKGEVKNPRKAKKSLPGKITPEQQEAIKQLVMTRGKALPKECQAKAMITMWSSLKSHFGCSYKEISDDQFTEALSIAARVPLEGEFIGKQEALPAQTFEIDFPVEWWNQFDYLLSEHRVNKFQKDKAGQFPARMLFGDSADAPSAINRVLFALDIAGYDVGAARIELQAYRGYMKSMYHKLSRISELSTSILGSNITVGALK